MSIKNVCDLHAQTVYIGFIDAFSGFTSVSKHHLIAMNIKSFDGLYLK